MTEQRILTDAEFNEERRLAEAERHSSPICCCANGGKPYEIDGVMVISRNVGCRVHAPQPPAYVPTNGNAYFEDWGLRKFFR